MDPLPRLHTRASLAAQGLERPDREPESGLVRLRRGVYVEQHGQVEDRERYRRVVLAAARTIAPGAVFSHESAACLLGLPVLGRWPDTVHVLAERARGGRTQLDVVRHCLGLEGVRVVEVDGVLVTCAPRTAFDIALTRSFGAGVVSADAVLAQHPAHAAELADLVEWYGRRRGFVKARRVAAFADGASGSPGESKSRVRMHLAGFVAPILQFEIVTDGMRDVTDFAWPWLRSVGEFDGEVKYRDDRYRRGGSAEDVVIREKNRENRIRRSMPRFIRWDAQDLRQPGRLERLLTEAGIPRHTP